MVICSLCGDRSPPRTHMFPQNSRAEVQLKWVQALHLPKEKEDSILAEMRSLEEKGSRPRWCTYHFDYDDAGIHFPKFYDPEEGKVNQEESKDDEDETKEEEKISRKRSATPSDAPRRSRRRKSTAAPAASTAAGAADAAALIAALSADIDEPSTSGDPVDDRSLQSILADLGIIPTIGGDSATATTSSSSLIDSQMKEEERGEATNVEKTLHSILMGAGLPVPDTLRAKKGVMGDDEEDEDTIFPPLRRTAQKPQVGRKMVMPMKRGVMPNTGAQMQQPILRPGGATLLSPKQLMNPMSGKAGPVPRVVVMPRSTELVTKLPSTVYNHFTCEKYDYTDSLRNFRMPCAKDKCMSELRVIMNRARSLEDKFDELADSVVELMQIYKNQSHSQSLSTLQGRAASVAGPVFGKLPRNPITDSYTPLSVQERRDRRLALLKDPVSLLTDDDLAGTVRKKVSKGKESDEEEEDEEAPDLEDDEGEDDDWAPSPTKKSRVVSRDDADDDAPAASDSEASPPMLEMAE
ncbi:hypothetical protein PFISCL1PPCAC_6437 [Pristionchus fissidentatus]|uniref:THAP-type domain-containing protein n=1 Tax=Pristionchus fissidentatus TaxID=1538716 RepID=A0AAV5V6A4_9BILA|nr:hypothetical protein PFISCL1PPCAC_6437 [Pristionchus fissidentatus]